MTIKAFVAKHKIPATGRKCLTHYRRSRVATCQVVRYPDGEIWGEIYSQRKGNTFMALHDTINAE
jgi:hypothetical protein